VDNPSPIILVFSAGFGDGHNSAARSIVAAVGEASQGRVQARMVDLFPQAVPRMEAFLKWGYEFVTTHFPALWGGLYKLAERDSGQGNLGWKFFPELHRQLSECLITERPAAVLSTFPMYPYLLGEVKAGIPFPKFCGTVITDSISINHVWTKAPTQHYFVTDEYSTAVLTGRGIAESMITATGFAVSPHFAALTPRPLDASTLGNFRVLYCATASSRNVQESLESLLTQTPPTWEITILLGRHEARLGETVRSVCARYPRPQLKVHGWTNDMPALLSSHDVIISKGGGATVHECFAAATPVLVNYFIPGQEAGNVDLLKRRGCGWHAPETKTLGTTLTKIVNDGRWAQAKTQMLHWRNPHGAMRIAEHALRAAGLA
jgi:processive 1,2-diacylglycerol beta-glucosyltransferase